MPILRKDLVVLPKLFSFFCASCGPQIPTLLPGCMTHCFSRMADMFSQVIFMSFFSASHLVYKMILPNYGLWSYTLTLKSSPWCLFSKFLVTPHYCFLFSNSQIVPCELGSQNHLSCRTWPTFLIYNRSSGSDFVSWVVLTYYLMRISVFIFGIRTCRRKFIYVLDYKSLFFTIDGIILTYYFGITYDNCYNLLYFTS